MYAVRRTRCPRKRWSGCCASLMSPRNLRVFKGLKRLGMCGVHRANPFSTLPVACPVLLRRGRITRQGSSPSCCMASHAGRSTRVGSRWLLQAFLLPASCSLGDGPQLLKVAHQDSEASAVGPLCCMHVAKDPNALPPFFELGVKDLADAKDKLQEILAREPTLSTMDVAEATSKVRITLHSADGRRTRNFLPGLGFDSLKLWPASCFPVSVRLELLQQLSEPDGELALEEVNVRRPQITARCCKLRRAFQKPRPYCASRSCWRVCKAFRSIESLTGGERILRPRGHASIGQLTLP